MEPTQLELDEIREEMLMEQRKEYELDLELHNDYDTFEQFIIDKYDNKLVTIQKYIDAIKEDFDRYGWEFNPNNFIDC